MGRDKVNKSIDDNCDYSFNAYYILSLKYEKKYDFLAMNSLALIISYIPQQQKPRIDKINNIE